MYANNYVHLCSKEPTMFYQAMNHLDKDVGKGFASGNLASVMLFMLTPEWKYFGLILL